MTDEAYPSVFIGSSVEGLKIAEAIQVALDYACDVVIWSQGIFGLSEGSLEALVNRLDDFDFAILVLTPDDMTESRGETRQSPRDNVLLELGLFIGRLGRSRTFAVCPRTSDMKLPSDLAGVTMADFRPHASGDVQSSVGAACTLIKRAIETEGVRPERFSKSTYADSPSNHKETTATMAPAAPAAESSPTVENHRNSDGQLAVARSWSDSVFNISEASCRMVDRGSVYSAAGYVITLDNVTSGPRRAQVVLQFTDSAGLGIERRTDRPPGNIAPGESVNLSGSVNFIMNSKADQIAGVSIEVTASKQR